MMILPEGFVEKEKRRGRGARTNRSGRYEPESVLGFDDGWNQKPDADVAGESNLTTLSYEKARHIITRNQSPDIGFDRSINPYRGCEHGCIYCYARPSHTYMGLSAGLDFERRLFAKPDAAALLEKELSHKRYKIRPIAMGTNTDPYQPVERREGITRSVLEVLWRRRHPLTLVTKSDLVLRDLDILSAMAKKNLVRVALSITTLERRLAREMEPRAPTPLKRLEAIQSLSDAGVPVAVMFAPVVPAINDSEMERVLEEAAKRGAGSAGYVLLRLPLEIKDLYEEWLKETFPNKAAHSLSLMRQMRGGKNYDARWFVRHRGEGAYAEMIAKRFSLAKARLRLDKKSPPLRCDLFRADGRQESLFDAFA